MTATTLREQTLGKRTYVSHARSQMPLLANSIRRRAVRPAREGAAPGNAMLVTFGDRVREKRLEFGWTQAKLAFMVESTPKIVQRIEAALGDPSLVMAWRIAGVVGVPLGDLIDAERCQNCYDKPPPGFTCKSCGKS
jgi:ribosome-binding protein aMBF1 (putative translation factor)